MSRAHDLLHTAFISLPEKPPDDSDRADKQKYSQRVSSAVANALAEEARQRGMHGTMPALPGDVGVSGAERRMSGGIGAKKVDVSWSTDESGLISGFSIKSINFRDRGSRNYQKNLTNRRGDLLIESVTLHRRFPYAVLVGFLFLDHGAMTDQTGRRSSTFINAHTRLRLFTGRRDPAGREEQYEKLYIVLMNANPFTPKYDIFEVGRPDLPVHIDQVFDDVVELIAERNSDFYEIGDGKLVRLRS